MRAVALLLFLLEEEGDLLAEATIEVRSAEEAKAIAGRMEGRSAAPWRSVRALCWGQCWGHRYRVTKYYVKSII